MQEKQNIIISIIVTALLTGIINFSIDFMNSFDASVRIGNTVKFNEQFYTPIDIEKRDKKVLNGLILSVTSKIKVNEIVSSSPIEIKTHINNTHSDLALITISSIPSNSLTRIYIPTIQNNKCCTVFNAGDLNLDVMDDTAVNNYFKSAIISAFIISIIYAVFLIIEHKFTVKKLQKLQKIRDEQDVKNKQIIEKLEAKYEKYRAQSDEEHKRLTAETEKLIIKQKEQDLRLFKMKSHIAYRISKYSREINFWRNTIRKILYNEKLQNKEEVEHILRNISKQQNTQLTWENTSDEQEHLIELGEMAVEIKSLDPKDDISS